MEYGVPNNRVWLPNDKHLRKMVYKGGITLHIDWNVYHFMITSKKFLSNHLIFI